MQLPLIELSASDVDQGLRQSIMKVGRILGTLAGDNYSLAQMKKDLSYGLQATTVQSQRQALASAQGEVFEWECRKALLKAGFVSVTMPTDIKGYQVDIVAHNQDEMSFLIECKGSYRLDSNPGLRRDRTFYAAKSNVLSLSVIHHQSFLVVMTSHLPIKGTKLDKQLRETPRAIWFDVWRPHFDFDRLRWVAQATENELIADYEVLKTMGNRLDRTKRAQHLA